MMMMMMMMMRRPSSLRVRAKPRHLPYIYITHRCAEKEKNMHRCVVLVHPFQLFVGYPLVIEHSHETCPVKIDDFSDLKTRLYRMFNFDDYWFLPLISNTQKPGFRRLTPMFGTIKWRCLILGGWGLNQLPPWSQHRSLFFDAFQPYAGPVEPETACYGSKWSPQSMAIWWCNANFSNPTDLGRSSTPVTLVKGRYLTVCYIENHPFW